MEKLIDIKDNDNPIFDYENTQTGDYESSLLSKYLLL